MKVKEQIGTYALSQKRELYTHNNSIDPPQFRVLSHVPDEFVVLVYSWTPAIIPQAATVLRMAMPFDVL